MEPLSCSQAMLACFRRQRSFLSLILLFLLLLTLLLTSARRVQMAGIADVEIPLGESSLHHAGSGAAADVCLQRIDDVVFERKFSGDEEGESDDGDGDEDSKGLINEEEGDHGEVRTERKEGEGRGGELTWRWRDKDDGNVAELGEGRGGDGGGKASGSKEACGFGHFSSKEARDLLQNRWVVVVGDSQTRLFLQALLRLLEPSRDFEFERHSDFYHAVDSHRIGVDFLWSPYVANVSAQIRSFREQHLCPDIIFTGVGLWDMLWLVDEGRFQLALEELSREFRLLLEGSCSNGRQHGRVLQEKIANVHEQVQNDDWGRKEGLRLGRAIDRLDASHHVGRVLKASNSGGEGLKGSASLPQEKQKPVSFWIGLPSLVPTMLNTERKREVMTSERLVDYVKLVEHSGLVHPHGPCKLVNFLRLTFACGQDCTNDGMHYENATYDAALMISLNLFSSIANL